MKRARWRNEDDGELLLMTLASSDGVVLYYSRPDSKKARLKMGMESLSWYSDR